MKNSEMFERTKILIGEEGLKKLNAANVCVVGVGGVGGATFEMLVRAGVGRITIIDFDVVDITNINRQLIATTHNVGNSKVAEWKKRAQEINPNCKVEAICEKICAENLKDLILPKFDIVVDAIDMVQNKVDLIDFCHKNGIKIISAMGAGNRLSNPIFRAVDIFKTKGDGLAKVLRKKLKLLGIQNHKVVCCETQSLPNEELFADEEKHIGSISYYPVMAGCVLCEQVVFELIKNDWQIF